MNSTVTLTFPAATAFVALARTVAAAMSARADLPIDQLEDVRLAVDEAVSQAITDAAPSADVTCGFTLTPGGLEVVVSSPSATGTVPGTDTFSWTVLRALVDHVEARIDAGVLTLRLQVTRHAPVDA